MPWLAPTPTPDVPARVIERLAVAGLKAVPTGLDHGTVMAIAEGETFEITTLRRDTACDGRHAAVDFNIDLAIANHLLDARDLLDNRRNEGLPAEARIDTHEQDEIDLGQLMREQFYLSLPMKPLCREDCQGLCGQCGIDLNDDTCECPAPVDPRWAKLTELRFDEDSSESR